MKTIRYAVVGLGHIAQIAVLPAFKHAKSNSKLTALVTGSPKKAKALCKKYRVDVYGYEDYDRLLSSGEIDAVYIALPNTMHRDYTCRALEAGIHVLCEKPLGISAVECADMIRAADLNHAKLMTAYRLHFDRPNLDAVKLCQSGKLGKLKSFVSSFSYILQDPKNIRVRPEPGAGPLWDIGIYCINANRYLFKENPTAVSATSTRRTSGPLSHVDESVSVLMHFGGEKTGIFTCSFGMTESAYFEVYGDKGMLRLENAYEYSQPPQLHTLIRGKRTKKKYPKVDQFAAELSYFSTCILKDRKIEPSGAEGLTDVAIMEAIEEAIQTGERTEVNYRDREQTARPTLSMARSLPPVQKPHLVAVHSASGD